MASTTATSLTLPPGTVFTTQTLVLVGVLYLVYLLLRSVYALFVYPYYVSPLRHLPTPKVSDAHGRTKSLPSVERAPSIFLED